MTRHDDTVYLRHMLDHALTAVQLAEGKGRSSVDTEPMFRFALLHLVCILGEAASRVSGEGRSKYTQIAWRDIIGMRNRLMHGYDVVDYEVLWKTAVEDLPVLIDRLKLILHDSRRP